MATSPINQGGSGIDVNSLVSQLMQVEQRPLVLLKQKEVDYQAKISAYGNFLKSATDLKTAISALKNSSIGMTASVSDSTFFSASASSSATVGTSAIQVANIASSQGLYSLRFGSQSGAIADLSVVGTQKISIQVGSGAAKEITIDSTNNTLSGIKDAINNAGVGATAAILKESDKFVIDNTNNTIVFNDGTADRTATLAAGTYTGADLATAIQSALNGAPGTTNTFTVDYNTTSSTKFTIQNTSGPAVNFLWSNTGTTTQQILGFSPVDSGNVATGAAVTGSGTVDGSYKLTLSANSTGSDNRIIIKADETGGGYTEAGGNADKLGLSSLALNATYNATTGVVTGGIANMTQSQTGLDAKLKINGLEVSRGSNTITDLVSGVTINLLKADPNYATNPTTINLSVALDSSSLTLKFGSLVSAYNSTMSALNALKGNQSNKGVLAGDSTLLSLSNLMRNLTTTKYGTGTNNTLSHLGLTHDKNGVLSFDASKLSAAYNSSASEVTNLINTMASSFDSSLSNYVTTIIPAGKDGYQTLLKGIQKKEDNMTASLALKETALRTKFIALDKLVTQLQSTSNYITQQMTSLSNIFGGKK